MKEITFVYPTSKLTRTIKVCETQKELINVIHERRSLKNGYVYVIYKNGGYFYQLFGSSGYKVNQFKRCGIMSATVSSSSGELFVFGDFAISPNDRVCIGKAAIKTYGSYSGQYDVKPEKVETISGQYDVKPEKVETISGQFYVMPEKVETISGRFYVKPEKVETKTEKAKTKTKIIINMEYFEDDIRSDVSCLNQQKKLLNH